MRRSGNFHHTREVEYAAPFEIGSLLIFMLSTIPLYGPIYQLRSIKH